MVSVVKSHATSVRGPLAVHAIADHVTLVGSADHEASTDAVFLRAASMFSGAAGMKRFTTIVAERTSPPGAFGVERLR